MYLTQTDPLSSVLRFDSASPFSAKIIPPVHHGSLHSITPWVLGGLLSRLGNQETSRSQLLCAGSVGR